MKKIMLSSISFLSPILLFSQEKPIVTASVDSNLELNKLILADKSFQVEPFLPVLSIGLLIYFIIYLVKFILEHRLKNKIIDLGISEQLSASILEKNGKNKYDDAMKLAIICFGIGTGLIITYYTMPLNIHSLAIMAFSVGASYLSYFFYLKNQQK
ncbi:hypothetical protein [Pedobacter sp. Hv1]|uniref:hypothetical protein n=1 Tax=Pedobacter sp. Hv1 TaxID=1740090 RepID=UPI0006D8C33E|nr:hypothetical protein [Pedobacter sp. Hv1]KQB99493.1 hypothetical protein AQF98_18185 [Pedobacter sp. Hv1]